jgi:hypothetical protein
VSQGEPDGAVHRAAGCDDALDDCRGARGVFCLPEAAGGALAAGRLPTITVSALMPGASPATMAATVATPLERHLGIIANVAGMSSESGVGITRITLQFGLNRSLDGAARDVQAAINAARADLPTSLRQNPSFYKVNPAASPVAILAMTSDTLTRGQIYDAASRVVRIRIGWRMRYGLRHRSSISSGSTASRPSRRAAKTSSDVSSRSCSSCPLPSCDCGRASLPCR